MEDPNASVDNVFKEESKFYEDAEIYWSRVEPTINGMLGGFGKISQIDIQDSDLFLRRLFSLKEKPGTGRALDCGAGIGRITKSLLSKHFDAVDLVDQNEKFLEVAKLFLLFDKNIGNYYHCGLQNFVPNKSFYDIIWCQWVLGHLTDEDLVRFLIHCSNALKENGLIVVKENISLDEDFPDPEDSSVTRTELGYVKIFKKAGLEVIRHCKQQRFPKQLLVVKIFALKPSKAGEVVSGSGTTDSTQTITTVNVKANDET